MTPTNPTLEAWNALTPEAAAAAILPCNGSHAWATQLAALRPFASPFDLTCTADIVWRSLSADAQQQAFDSHPRIGEHQAKSATPESLALSFARTIDGAVLRQPNSRHRHPASQRQPCLRSKIPPHLHRLRHRQIRRRNAGHPPPPPRQRPRHRTPRSRRTTTPDHPAPPPQMAGLTHLTARHPRAPKIRHPERSAAQPKDPEERSPALAA